MMLSYIDYNLVCRDQLLTGRSVPSNDLESVSLNTEPWYEYLLYGCSAAK